MDSITNVHGGDLPCSGAPVNILCLNTLHYDEHKVLYATDELLKTTFKTNDVL